MGLNACRIGHIGKGICCEGTPHSATGPIISGSPNVNTNGLAAARVSDIVISDSCGHGRKGTIYDGSPKTFINGLNAARIGDPFEGCFTGELIEGSDNVLM
jgi:uncharacterized Zn-binding protein involved in type VI secretion